MPICRICNANEESQFIRAEHVFGGTSEHKFWQCKECNAIYGCCDDNHPYIKQILERKNSKYISGKLTRINGVSHFDYQELRRTPAEVRQLIQENGWKKVVAFQTRNPMHRSHMELTLSALKEAGDGARVLLHPVVGVTQECDIDYHTRVNCYKKLLKYYKEGKADILCGKIYNPTFKNGNINNKHVKLDKEEIF